MFSTRGKGLLGCSGDLVRRPITAAGAKGLGIGLCGGTK